MNLAKLERRVKWRRRSVPDALAVFAAVALAFESCGGAGVAGLESDASGFSALGKVRKALAHGKTVSSTARKRARIGCIDTGPS